MKDHSIKFLKIVNEAKSRIRETNVDAVKAKIDKGDQFYLVDVREQDEWKNGHLPNSIYLGKGIIERDIEKTIEDTNAEIILYCGGGFRSALVADNIQNMGYRKAISMDGGYSGWVNAGHPIVTD